MWKRRLPARGSRLYCVEVGELLDFGHFGEGKVGGEREAFWGAEQRVLRKERAEAEIPLNGAHLRGATQGGVDARQAAFAANGHGARAVGKGDDSNQVEALFLA